MTNREKVLKIIAEKGRITSGELSSLLGVSRQYVSILLSPLIADKKVIRIGATRTAFYVTPAYSQSHPEVFPPTFKKKYENKALEEHKVLIEIEEKLPQLFNLSENVRSIFTFAFSEMFNNAIEHSESKVISLEVALRGDILSFDIDDTGVGAFRNIMKKKNLQSEIEAIQDLLKGKTTTMPKSHSGEGIFFTSRASDLFVLDSYGYQMIVNSLRNDTQIKKVEFRKRGTKVTFEINTQSQLHLTDVFRKYTNLTDESDFGFDKTEIRVKLFTTGGIHISRSQARRILSGLEKFKIIMLDFEKVPVVGQAFADEIYRVFQNAYPNILIQEENLSEGVRFMVERSKNEAKKQ